MKKAITLGLVAMCLFTSTFQYNKVFASGSQKNEVQVSNVTEKNLDTLDTVETTVNNAYVKFKDIAGSWAESTINQAVSLGLVKGYSDGGYHPKDNVTRAEFATMLYRATSQDKKTNSSIYFPDMSSNWAMNEVNTLVDLGFINPADYKKGFEPNTQMTRAEMVKWMTSGLTHANTDFSTALKDTANTVIPVTEFYKGGIPADQIPYVAVAYGTGLMTGMPDGSFKPADKTTRAEVATLLIRYINVEKSNPAEYSDLTEMREVGARGTNIFSIANYSEDPKRPFNHIIDQPITMKNNSGTITIHKMIVVKVKDINHMSLYGRMFFDKDQRVLNNYYYIFTDFTIASRKEKIDILQFKGSTMIPNLLYSKPVDSKIIKKYGVKSWTPQEKYPKEWVNPKGERLVGYFTMQVGSDNDFYKIVDFQIDGRLAAIFRNKG